MMLSGPIRLLALACLATAAMAQSAWVQARTMVPRRTCLVSDLARDRVLLFGGEELETGNDLHDTWEWDGIAWRPRLTARWPHGVFPYRPFHMAFDLARQRTVLVEAGQTWEYDGVDWQLRSPVTPLPGPGSLAFDVVAQRVLCFAPAIGTWLFDGATWTQLQPLHAPSRAGVMSTDLIRQRIVLFDELAQTWEWDGGDWLQRPTTGGPTFCAAMAYDFASARTFLVDNLQTWTWDGAAWTLLQPAHSPPGLAQHLAFDPARGRLLLFDASDFADLCWGWTGSDWSRIATVPPPRFDHAMATDEARGGVLLFGGDGDGHAGTYGDTWLWRHGSWQAVQPVASPPARVRHRMVWDRQRQRVVLYGGWDHFTYLSDTWEWDGTTWLQRQPAANPGPRASHAMAYDAVRQRTVLFGGLVGGGTSGTWQWDGSNWQQLPLAPAIAGPEVAMVFDEARQRCVLVVGSYTQTAETWEWDGLAWTQRSPALLPPVLWGFALAYDAARQRTVLFGSEYMSQAGYEWDGSNWTALPYGPRGRRQPALAGDPGSQRVLLFGGQISARCLTCEFPIGDTWLLGTPQPMAALQPIGSGCAGSQGVPQLTADAPFVGNPGLGFDLLSAAARAPCLFGMSLGTQTAPLGGGCTQYLQAPLAWTFAVTNGSGFASMRTAVPPLPSLYGVTLAAQAVVLDPLAAWSGLALTAGLRITLGD